MTSRELRELVCSVLQIDGSGLKDDEIVQSRLRTWDSLRHLRLIVALEQQTKKKFTAKQIAEMISLNAITKEVGASRS